MVLKEELVKDFTLYFNHAACGCKADMHNVLSGYQVYFVHVDENVHGLLLLLLKTH